MLHRIRNKVGIEKNLREPRFLHVYVINYRRGQNCKAVLEIARSSGEKRGQGAAERACASNPPKSSCANPCPCTDGAGYPITSKSPSC